MKATKNRTINFNPLLMTLAYEASELGTHYRPTGAILEYIKDNKKEYFAAYDLVFERLAMDLIKLNPNKGTINLYTTHEPTEQDVKLLNQIANQFKIEDFNVFYDQPAKPKDKLRKNVNLISVADM